MYRSLLAHFWHRPSALRVVAVMTLLVCLAACGVGRTHRSYVPGFVSPYRPDIQQGNWITQQQASQLQPGMTRDQVRFLLGSPLLTDIFHADRWDYLFLHQRGKTRKPPTPDDLTNPDRPWHFTVYFENDRLVRWEGDALPVGQPFSPTAVPGATPAQARNSASGSTSAALAGPTTIATPGGAEQSNATPAPKSPLPAEPSANGLLLPSQISSPESSGADEPVENGTSVGTTPLLQTAPAANQPLGSRSASGLKMPVLP